MPSGVVRSLRLRRAEFIACWANLPIVHVVMEACGSAHPKSERQHVIQLMHRTRQQWQRDRTARINLARGMLREFG